MAIDGIIGKVIGNTQVFGSDGSANPVTAIQAGPCTITQIKTQEVDGYESVQLGFDPVRALNKPRQGHLRPVGQLFRYLRELSADGIEELTVGDQISVNLFRPGDRVDVMGKSKGRGFAGGVKRHHFRGGPKTHGQSDRHRAPGSIGAGSTPGRVLKGLKMAGHMGNARVTVKNLEVVLADADKNLLLVKGSVPGAHESLLIIRKSHRQRS